MVPDRAILASWTHTIRRQRRLYTSGGRIARC